MKTNVLQDFHICNSVPLIYTKIEYLWKFIDAYSFLEHKLEVRIIDPLYQEVLVEYPSTVKNTDKNNFIWSV